MDYEAFLQSKIQEKPFQGIQNIKSLNENLFDFQRDIVAWALKRGRSALFAGTGLGKSLMELSWAEAIVQETGGRVIVFTPLAVAAQMEREAKKFGINAKHVSRDDGSLIVITNYQKIEHFDISQFSGVVLDESSILKNYAGHFRGELIDRCRDVPFRLAATATPSPNDYMELGNHAEFCGIMSYTDMLSTFFVHDGSSTQNWRLKGHAEEPFWKWMASWSVMLRNPSELGYDGRKYILPNLHQIQHTVNVEYKPDFNSGFLFPLQATDMKERLHARRSSIDVRVAHAAELVNGNDDCWVVWCNMNEESEKLCRAISGAVEVKGSDSDEKKESILADFADGKIRVLVTKPSICGFGMNWQHCNHTCFVGLNDSFEQIYQAIRRFWRFGQTKEVYAHFIASEMEGRVVANIKKKEAQAEHMAAQMTRHMSDLCAENIKGAHRERMSYIATSKMEIPQWL